jgi:cytochrome c peroxidase
MSLGAAPCNGIVIIALTVTLLGASSVAASAPLDEPIKPIPTISKQDPARAGIGRQLFHDPRLSANGRVSCASCHRPEHGGADVRAHSLGLTGQATAVNAPTVFNAALNFRQFWNGRAETLEQQIDMVIQNPVEMGSTWQDVVAKVSADPAYRRAFASSYPQGVTPATIQNAIATYERTLLTLNSRFDRYLRGDANAISAEEKAGYLKFKQYGCVACHQGANIGGNMFQKFGVMGDYFAARGDSTAADQGRYLVTGEGGDRHVFKVPSLRNVALTAPYFHDGSAKTLDAALDVMFRYQLGRVASAEDKAAIIQFLNTLTGDVAGRP